MDAPAAALPAHVLPDLLRPGLKIVFCGTAAGNVSARRGAYYAHPQNRFWSALHAFGLTPRKPFRFVGPGPDPMTTGLNIADFQRSQRNATSGLLPFPRSRS